MEKVGAYTDRATEVGEWRPGNPATGQPATPMLAAYFNMLQRELVALVESAGLRLDAGDNAQLRKAVAALIRAALDAGLVWDGIKNKPDQATRWPTFGEVTGKPDQATRWPTFGEVTGKPDQATRWPTFGEVTGKPDQATRWPTFGEVTGKPEFLDRASFDGSSFVFRGAIGDVLYFGRDNLLVFVNAQGENRLVFRQGRMEAGEVPWARISEKPDQATRWPSWNEIPDRPINPEGNYIRINAPDGTHAFIGKSELIIRNAQGVDLFVIANGRMSVGLVPADRVEGLGSSARLGVIDTQDPEQIPRDGGGAFATSASTVAGLRDRIRMFGEIGCYALAQNLTGQRLRPGSEVDGGMLMPTACDSVNDDGGRIDKSLRLSGVWRCLGQAEDVGDNDNRYRKTTLFVRIR